MIILVYNSIQSNFPFFFSVHNSYISIDHENVTIRISKINLFKMETHQFKKQKLIFFDKLFLC